LAANASYTAWVSLFIFKLLIDKTLRVRR